MRRFVPLTAILLTAAALPLATVTVLAPAASAASPCDPPVSRIACENTRPGTPESAWQVNGVGDQSIQGFATAFSVNAGQTVGFKVASTASSYRIDVMRLGYYQGNGARTVAAGIRPSVPLPQSQPNCLTDAQTGLIDCGNWTQSASWSVPTDAMSGLYLARLVRDDTGGASLVPFVVRNDAVANAMLFQTSDTTWQAYNTYGGNSLYRCTVACPPGNPGGYKAAYKDSYNRPFNSAVEDFGRSWFQHAEYPMIRFLEANGYDVGYMSGLDVATRAPLVRNHRLFLSVGHDEYWSAEQRANVEAARDAGVHLAFFSGNEVFWKTRWEPSIDASKAAGRTLVSYKDTHFDGPVDPVAWTGTWRDPRFSPPSDGGRPENSLTGQFFLVNSGTTVITVPARYRTVRFWRGTAVAGLGANQTATLGAGLGTLGYEWDEASDNGFRAPGLMELSETNHAAEAFLDYGTNVTQNVPSTHHLTLYRAPSGALVFGAGTVQWSWGLDGAVTGRAPDPTMQQATVNLFADQGVQPYALLPGLVAATASTDTQPPTTTISTPTNGTTVGDGAVVSVTGTASDTGGGVVTGVEVSTDGGRSWSPATGTSSWSYAWVAHGNPTATVMARAVDDSGNLQPTAAGISVGVTCPCSVWGPNVTPPGIDSGDTNAVELGLKFRSDVGGTVTGVRFYKAPANTGTHVGSLWSESGALLARATFTGESASGWQQASFSPPVAVTAGTTYVVSYHAPAGHYSFSAGHMYPFPAPAPDGKGSLDSPPLHALRNTVSVANGLYSYSPQSTFPVSTYQAENYWVDLVFSPAGAPAPTAPAAPTGVTATAGDASAAVSWTAPADGGSPLTSYTVTPRVNGVAQASRTVTGSPPATSTTITGLTNGTTYTFTVRASNAVGAGPESSPSAPVTPTTSTPPPTTSTPPPTTSTPPPTTSTPPPTTSTPAATVPAAPTAVTAVGGVRRATVSWTAPSDGGSPITSYRVTPYIGTSRQQSTVISGNPPATSVTVTGLRRNTTYTFRVAATNAVGTGPLSAPSNAVFVTARATLTALSGWPSGPIVARSGPTSVKWVSLRMILSPSNARRGVVQSLSCRNVRGQRRCSWSPYRHQIWPQARTGRATIRLSAPRGRSATYRLVIPGTGASTAVTTRPLVVWGR